MYGDTFRRWLGCLLALALMLAPARAATITGTIYAADGDLFSGTMLFRTLRTPLVSGSTLVTGGDYRVSVTNGALSTTLLAGDYRVFVGADTKGFIIAVPSGSSSYAILGLITNAITYTDQAYPWESTPPATASISGTVKTDVDAGDPVVYLKSSIDALLATNAAPSKLDITNGTAVNLAGSLTNVSVKGTLTYDLSDESRMTANLDYGIALDVGLSSTTAKARIRSVSTIADLVSIDPLTSDIFSYVKVLGYSAAGDGGGGDVRRVLASSVLGTQGTNGAWFQSTANPTYAWQRVETGGPVNAKWFGAKGDNSTDDTAALQAALAWAASNPGVLIPAGIYRISSTLVLTNQVKLSGAGASAGTANGTVIVMTTDNTPIIRCTGTTSNGTDWGGVSGIQLRYLNIQPATNTSAACIQLDANSFRYEFNNVLLRRGAYGIRALGNSWQNKLLSVHVGSFTVSAIDCASGNGTPWTWQDVYVQNLGDETVTTTGAITGVALSASTNITFTCSSLPTLLTTNRLVVVTGLDSAYNASYFVTGVTGTTFTASSATPLSAPVDVTGTVTFTAQPCAGPVLNLGGMQHSIRSLDVEHCVVTNGNVVISYSENTHISDAHFESIYPLNNPTQLINNQGKVLDFGSINMINSGAAAGAVFNILYSRNSGVGSGVIHGGAISFRDLGTSGSPSYVLGAKFDSTSPNPSLWRIDTNRTARANASGAVSVGIADIYNSTGSYLSASSGTEYGQRVFNEVNQSGTARAESFRIQTTRTAGGSGQTWPLSIYVDNSVRYDFRSDGSAIFYGESGGTRALTLGALATTNGSLRFEYNAANDYRLVVTPVSTGMSLDVWQNSTAATGRNLLVVPTGGALVVGGAIELGNGSDTTVSRQSAGVVALESVPVIDASVGTLAYSGTTVNITAGKGVAQEDTLTCTNSFSLTFSSLNNKDAGYVTIWPAATNCTITLPSYGFGPSGSTLTVNGGTGNTNYTVLTWFNTVVGGTNRVSVNALNYYR